MPELMHKEKKIEYLEDGTFDKFMKFRKLVYLTGEDPDDRDHYVGFSDDELDALFQLKKQKYERRSKINKWFDYWSKQDKIFFFLTFNFNDDALNGTAAARRKAVYRQVEQFHDYVLNIDYGNINKREHFHAIVVADHEAVELVNLKWSKKYKCFYDDAYPLFDNYNKGWHDLRIVNPFDNDGLKKYESKLTSHAIKTGSYRLSFKRNSSYRKYVDDVKYLNKRCRGENNVKRKRKSGTMT